MMTIDKVEFIDKTGIPGLTSPVLPFEQGRTEARAYIDWIMNNILLYSPDINRNININFGIDGKVEIKIEFMVAGENQG